MEIKLSGCQMHRAAMWQGNQLKVHIPAGISDGKSIRLRGKGMPGVSGGKAGDLLLKVRVGKRPGFERKDMDVYSKVTIPFTTAVLGGEAVVQTLTGRVVCKINPGTQSGTKIRLKRQRNRVYEGCRKIWRSVCDCSDRCTKESQ